MRSDSDPRTIRELGLKAWITDVLWYHHKGKIIGGLVGIIVVLWLLTLARSKTNPDITVLLVTGTEVDTTAVNTLESAFASALGDVNGDGRFSQELAEKYGGTDRAIRISDVPVISELVGFNDDSPLSPYKKGRNNR